MSNNSYDVNEISNRYSRALLLSVKNEKDIDIIYKNFKNFVDLIKNNTELEKVFCSPLIKLSKKINCIKLICNKTNYQKIFINFLLTLTNHGKLPVVSSIFEKFNETLNEKQGILKVKITTSDILDKKLEIDLKNKLSKHLNSKIELNKVVNPEIIGGIIIQIKSLMIDQSIRSKLSNFNLSMKG